MSYFYDCDVRIFISRHLWSLRLRSIFGSFKSLLLILGNDMICFKSIDCCREDVCDFYISKADTFGLLIVSFFIDGSVFILLRGVSNETDK